VADKRNADNAYDTNIVDSVARYAVVMVYNADTTNGGSGAYSGTALPVAEHSYQGMILDFAADSSEFDAPSDATEAGAKGLAVGAAALLTLATLF